MSKLQPLVLILCAVPLMSMASCKSLSFIDRINNDAVNKAIKDSPELQQVERICTDIPLPEDFVLLNRGGLDDKEIVIHYYYSSRTPYSEARLFWDSYFEKAGWQKLKEIDSFPRNIQYIKSGFRVSIFNGGMGDAEYSINCRKVPESQ